jgi:hypothetical protein
MRIFLLAILIMLQTLAYAQFTWGPKIGMGISTFKHVRFIGYPTLDNFLYSGGVIYNPLITPQVGVIFDFKLSKVFSIRPELIYNERGFKSSRNIYYDVPVEVKCKVSYVELPLNLVVGADLGTGRLEVFGGAAIAYGLGGEATSEYTSKKYNFQTGQYEYPVILKENGMKAGKVPVYTESDEIYFNQLNTSLNIGLGYNFKGVVFQVAYNWGLSNIMPKYENEKLNELRNKQVITSSAYTFGLAYLLKYR